ncbi:uncharacterized protein EDB91DRAFT_1246624 [Suillus paluster]|uniref:uncharacterized protein n=1 Tax=Suillus paluster TaxID=48578 RepID=UPI001B87D3C5|nr:uncharacterized protein EDB91DRAFT_1246624 [Suillus paluster]KAG1745121.1 hypothetical protein EDB91DRAFT_1246624 [Suillus paluster]
MRLTGRQSHDRLKNHQPLSALRWCFYTYPKDFREAGLEMPVVNQIEVSISMIGSYDHDEEAETIISYIHSASKNPLLNIVARTRLLSRHTPLLCRSALDIPVIQELAVKYSKDAAQIIIKWSLQRGFVPTQILAVPLYHIQRLSIRLEHRPYGRGKA